MKNKFLIALIVMLSAVSSNLLAEPQAIFNHKQFQVPGKGIYIENYLSFVSSSLKYKNPESPVLQAKLLITQILSKNDSVVDFKKYTLLGPVLIDSLAVDFKDQQRFFVSPGLYELEIVIQDLNSNSEPVTLEKFLSISPFDLATDISDIEIIDYLKKTTEKNKFSKSGYDIYPMVSNYIPSEVEKLAFYYEIYNKEPKKVLIKEYIETYYGNRMLPNYLKRSVKNLKEVTPIIRAFDITQLPSGNYNLVIEIRDSENQLMTTQKVFVQRVNVDTKPQVVVEEEEQEQFDYGVSPDSLDYYLRALLPVCNTLEYKFLNGNLDKYNDTMKEMYFINFWQTRYGVNGIAEWTKYKSTIEEVERRFGTKARRGYATDMGRVFLKYGRPNDIIEKLNEQGTYPYAIWHYYQTQSRSNVQFVFYVTTSVAQEFELIHSNMPGEITNRDWQILVNMRTGGQDNRVQDDARRMR